MRAVAFGNDGSGGQDATSPFTIAVAAEAASPVLPVPLSPWLVLPLSLLLAGAAAAWRRRHPDQTALLVLLVFVAGSGLVWAATVLRDGNVGDWAGVSPAVTDAKGDAPANADIVAVFVQQDGVNLYVRIDADVRKDAAANQAPVVNAGTAQTVTLPAGATLSGSATDDGLPNPPGALTYAWSKVSGPGTVSFGNTANASTTASFSVAAGSYVLRLTASDGVLSASDELTVSVSPVGTRQRAAQSSTPARTRRSRCRRRQRWPEPPATTACRTRRACSRRPGAWSRGRSRACSSPILRCPPPPPPSRRPAPMCCG